MAKTELAASKPLFFNIQRRNLLTHGLAWGGLAGFALASRTTKASTDPALVPPPIDLELAGEAEVIEIIDGDTVVLSTGQEIRLVGIQAPKIPLGRPNFRPWPHGEAARKVLDDLVRNEVVRFGYAGARQDRHGRGLAHLVLTNGQWVQGWMLRNGHARVYSFPDNRRFVPEMLANERMARAERQGLWDINFYDIRQATDERIGPFGYFHLVEGVVASSTRSRDNWFINFGENYREDFTARLRMDTVRRFARDLTYLDALAGNRIRVRGWMTLRNGPAIDITHPEQIELLA